MKISLIIMSLSVLCVGNVYSQEEIQPPPPPIEVSEDPERLNGASDIVDFPDVEAQFPGDAKALQKYIQESFVYPEKARKKGDQGRVYVVFIVEKDGAISSVEVMRGGLTKELNKEAIRLVSEMPNWIPAEMNGEPVRARCRLPINFTLGCR